MKKFYFLLSVLFALILSCGDDDGNDPDPQPTPSEPEFVRVFPNISFNQPVYITTARIGNEWMFVVERRGMIYSLSTPEEATEAVPFLDIRDRVKTDGGEQGLLGLAFHPQFGTNGLFYVYYTNASDQMVVAEYSTNATGGDAATERVLMEIDQPFANHNGGTIAFGQDGFLYIGLGDGGGGGDPVGAGQDPTTLLGSMLRIDVDNTSGNLAYAIPSDNPFVGNTEGIREEVFAYGLRNPYRFSFDQLNGNLYAADVGQNRIEEVDLIVSGGNYGWNTMEGSECFEDPNCNTDGLILPITEYDHSIGQSITGGHVYRGTEFASLQGRYFFGDFVSGRVFTIDVNDPEEIPLEFARLSVNISSFGESEQGRLFILDYSGGGVYRLEQAD